MLLVFIPSRYVPHYVKCCFFTSLNPPSPPSLISQIAFTSPVKLTASNILYPLDQMAPFLPLPFPPPSPLDASCISSHLSSCPQSPPFYELLIIVDFYSNVLYFVELCYITRRPCRSFFPRPPVKFQSTFQQLLIFFYFFYTYFC